jgi:DNA/RNA-binding protein KIN17
MHTQSESHVRKALSAGENFKGVQEDYSKAFLHDFTQLLKTGHGEKAIHINKFYQEYIANKEAVHMNATKWNSLTEFAKYLGRESICRVEEKDDGIFISWIDTSPEALKRKEALRRKEMRDRGDEEREQMLLREQIQRAQKDAAGRGDVEEESAGGELVLQEGEKITLSFGTKAKPQDADSPSKDKGADGHKPNIGEPATKDDAKTSGTVQPVSLKLGMKPQPKNVFKNAFSGGPKKVMVEQPKKMSEAERIMKEEMERKRIRDSRAAGGPPNKKPRF